MNTTVLGSFNSQLNAVFQEYCHNDATRAGLATRSIDSGPGSLAQTAAKIDLDRQTFTVEIVQYVERPNCKAAI